VSIGHSYYTGEESEDVLFGRADEAMYADKQHARQAAPRTLPYPMLLASIAG
jgi:GGDEF domain-containing protein